MKTLYFDLIGGISGDMIVGALLDLGVDFRDLKTELKKIKLKGYDLKKSSVERGHLKATQFNVIIQKDRNYSYSAITHLIKNSRLSDEIKNKISKVYQTLRNAELGAHGHKGEVHFEQLGQVDSIVDIAASCICLDRMGISDISYSAIPLNKNIAPATFELLLNKRMYFTGWIYENVTPTGMAFLSTLGRQIDPLLKDTFKVERCGYGAGSLNPVENPNVLRVVRLSSISEALQTEEILVVEANIDDMSPQFFEYLFERLYEAGVLEAFVESIYMKKTRPGFLLTVLSKREDLGKITHLILKETTTLGLRFYPVERFKLDRKIRSIDFMGQRVRLKIAQMPQGGFKIMPEYEDCKLLAKEKRMSLSKVYQGIQQKAQIRWRSQV